MSGLETLAEIRRRFPLVGVLLFGEMHAGTAAQIVQALELGALDFIPKPEPAHFTEGRARFAADLLRWFKAFRERPGGRRRRLVSASRRQLATPLPKDGVRSRLALLVIGASTGGPQALSQILPLLPGDLPVPVVIAQHMPPAVAGAFARRLAETCLLEVREARTGEILVPGLLLLAPGGRNLRIRKHGDRLEAQVDELGAQQDLRPSVNVLFQSVAEAVQGPVLSLILTGMGDDGLDGIRALRVFGGYSLVQDLGSSIVFGMPQSVVEAGLADEILTLADLPSRITTLLRVRGACFPC